MLFALESQTNGKALQVEQNWEKLNEWNDIFFLENSLFVNFVHSTSFRYKRKASKMGGGTRRDFEYPNFPTIKWIVKLEVQTGLVF